MRPDVLIKYGFLSEAFSTLWANVRLLPCVNPDMLVEYRLLTKRLTVGITTNFKYVISYFGGRGKFHLFAVGASIRSLVRMDPQMLHQMRLLPEAFVTIRTIERSFIRVSSFVLRQRRFLFESTSTNLKTGRNTKESR